LEEVGRVFKYFQKIGVAAVELKRDLKIGDTIVIRGATTNLVQKVTSLQKNGVPISHAKAGDEVGIKVEDRVRPDDLVFKKL